ncbi:hypothetical protein SAMN02745121_08833 [Nannocystis exedens]|uniref:Uncharacterized protein n=1 Tax=Nannocystis exedens TaxID=54 RepID=A0A1I2IRC6_9BACT|nr:hypothetical protein NAEX_01147 [Nannocystis exedens]SFF43366.1 hypothetical protein SAMN02745121_08833 [Nannocystis exedens]
MSSFRRGERSAVDREEKPASDECFVNYGFTIDAGGRHVQRASSQPRSRPLGPAASDRAGPRRPRHHADHGAVTGFEILSGDDDLVRCAGALQPRSHPSSGPSVRRAESRTGPRATARRRSRGGRRASAANARRPLPCGAGIPRRSATQRMGATERPRRRVGRRSGLELQELPVLGPPQGATAEGPRPVLVQQEAAAVPHELGERARERGRVPRVDDDPRQTHAPEEQADDELHAELVPLARRYERGDVLTSHDDPFARACRSNGWRRSRRPEARSRARPSRRSALVVDLAVHHWRLRHAVELCLALKPPSRWARTSGRAPAGPRIRRRPGVARSPSRRHRPGRSPR